ncbi:OmpA family protein [Paraclostridium sordellii]|uniref:Flagellar motor rotation protein MotB (Chemotaxis protein MotB) n=1 Tax=Paraclostridium sordellii TaxID=1505 RepID=A0A0C7QVS7_PARSO|nr:OmpA family protein [Paeniclostridium sordellii]QYE97274.1 OmpA family protein [Paeniclostridium sordellii]CEN21627.1 flagellar motor rotation protein MotB (Chemotaxis protein MotB) [[Clostridium] sordellii] [Paeniclostridium sordellii]CEN79288.1 flagellar motor rotation protein MotB (Chemotaxis protein MotB) [[Clostridium] sordellii] [Paeniclostridium sordellii]CEP81486.1 flagellar motor rotation protein MotB (Chemotaxis protein MotB) [[Clostridium] sordellii] [Paeniclostridium sordellii]C
MPRRDKRRGKNDDMGESSWMDTYADTITLLLTFFILLYSMSAVDSQKLKQLSEALQESLGGGNTSVSQVKDLEELKVDVDKDAKDMKEDLEQKVKKAIANNNLNDSIKVRKEDRGIVLQLDETILFDSGRDELKSTSINALDTITTLANGVDNDILVEGHTDNVPIHNTRFASNWDLSTARAVSVVSYFVEKKGMNPTKFSVKGYGEYKPLLDNSTPENRSVNRRVDILIVDKKDDQQLNLEQQGKEQQPKEQQQN